MRAVDGDDRLGHRVVIACGGRELAVSRRGRQRPQRGRHQLRTAEDHRGHQARRLVELVVTAGGAGHHGDSGRHRQLRRHQIRRGQRALVGEMQRGAVGVADVAVGCGRVADVTAAGSVAGRVGAASQGRSASVRRNNSTALEASGSTARRCISSVKCCASGVSADGLPSTEPKRRVWALPGHPRIENQQRRAVVVIAPARRCPRRVDDVRRRRHQHVHEFHEAMAVVAGHREQAPRHPGQPGAGRDEQRGARRCDTVGQQLPRRGHQQLRPQGRGRFPVRWRALRTGPWRWHARRHHDVSRTHVGLAVLSTVGQAPQQDPVRPRPR